MVVSDVFSEEVDCAVMWAKGKRTKIISANQIAVLSPLHLHLSVKQIENLKLYIINE